MTTRTKGAASGRKVLARQPLDPPIVEIRGKSVMLDHDLADAYGVTTKALNQAVKRNVKRFPADFRFRLTRHEREEVVTNCDHLRKLKYAAALPWAFTEHGALMAATVLNSPRAVQMSVFVIRAFVRLRAYARGHAEIAKRLETLERRVTDHDEDLGDMFKALRALLAPSPRNTREIGFAKT